jgi:phosphosulfolactate phosphohydrolase-like enzyme
LCASLVVASATAAYLDAVARHTTPTYLITGRFADRPDTSGDDDLATAEHIEHLRLAALGNYSAAEVTASAERTAHRVASSPDAAHTLSLGAEHVDPSDIDYCIDVDRFRFAMSATHTAGGLVLHRVMP